MNNAEEQISDLEDRIMEITQSGWQTENQRKKLESNIRDLWDNIKQANLHVIGIPGEEKEKGIENIFEEILSENFQNLKETNIKIQEAHRAPNKLNPNSPTPRQMAKVKYKERILKAVREKHSINYKGPP
uniref:L1 transposable element RRM domain-containing protein n=1 Tax=Sus scrofa TaxID=9823 RepID=A0A8D1NPS1_PIG